MTNTPPVVDGDPPTLRIWLADSVRVEVGGRMAIDRHYSRRRAKALLVYLYLNRGREFSKYQLLADLWPEVECADPGLSFGHVPTRHLGEDA